MVSRMIRLTKTNKKWTKNHKIIEVLFETVIFDDKGHELKDKELSPRNEFILSFEIKNNEFILTEFKKGKRYRDYENKKNIKNRIYKIIS